jgi:hypothetical protein
LITGVILPLIIAVMYQLFFKQKVAQLEGSLRKNQSARHRARNVRALVEAMSGHGAVADSVAAARAATAVPLILIVMFTSLLFTSTDAEHNARRAGQSRASDIEDIESFLQTEMKPVPADDDDRSGDAASRLHRLQEGLPAMRAEVKELARLERNAWLLQCACLFMVAMFICQCWYVNVVRIPYVALRRLFAHEIERFTLRIQGLASKAELADLADAEVEARNEEGLRAFLAKASEIAERHNVARLASRFDLWRES